MITCCPNQCLLVSVQGLTYGTYNAALCEYTNYAGLEISRQIANVVPFEHWSLWEQNVFFAAIC